MEQAYPESRVADPGQKMKDHEEPRTYSSILHFYPLSLSTVPYHYSFNMILGYVLFLVCLQVSPLHSMLEQNLVFGGFATPSLANVTICYYRYEKEDSYIYSPGYPAPYPDLADCTYELMRPSKKFCGVKLFVEELDVEVGPRDVSCDRDWLEVLSCVPSASARLCGQERGTSYQYLFQEGAVSIRLRFVSDDTGRRRGFRIRYEMLQICSGPFLTARPTPIPGVSQDFLCETRIKDFRGTIFTPGYPKSYPPNMECIYEFQRADPFVCGVEMKTVKFDVEKPLRIPGGLGACADFFHMPSCAFMCGAMNFTCGGASSDVSDPWLRTQARQMECRASSDKAEQHTLASKRNDTM
ncbi:unnamed protein product [Darwinula stevensoni]|uniref:CUB domain-containing protein n=1 Tax=Darwinula stevensoni TaxID=69355 RepID=A0A7R8X383_9CRUS|nr:unnamed protein product [Darwinula stevensoni]CAG0884721.1 unnamed protein product [Darwinula stevensoni]